MENAEEIFHFLEDFSKRKPKTIPQELNEYLAYVARTGDPVYQWCHVKCLFKEKLLNVITDFYETTPGVEIPPYPNVDPFNYDIMKNSLLERLDSFTSAPFTVQRICELLTFPRKQYNRVDKFMRAIEKNILVVSTREPGLQRHSETENGDVNEPIVNGSDNNSDYNVDVEMEDMSWKENNGQQRTSEPQPSSSETRITVDDIEARLKAKEDTSMDTQEKTSTQYESVTPPELNVTTDDSTETKNSETSSPDKSKADNEPQDAPITSNTPPPEEIPPEEVKKTETTSTLIIPEIKIDDAEMTEQKLLDQSNAEKQAENNETVASETKLESEVLQVTDESSSDSKDEMENKLLSDVLTSSEESSSSSDNTDGNSNSPKTDEGHSTDVQESSTIAEPADKHKGSGDEPVKENKPEEETPKINSENYSISDVNSELPQAPVEEKVETEKQKGEPSPMDAKEESKEEIKADATNTSTESKDS